MEASISRRGAGKPAVSAAVKKPRVLILVLVFFASFVWAVYRSVSTGLTVSEAVTFNHFVARPITAIATLPFDPANNVLSSIATRQVLQIFRLTEWSLRLVSLLGLLLYIAVAWRFGAAGVFFILNPFLLGWLPDSGGLWMACGFFLMALYRLTLTPFQNGQLAVSSQCLALAVGFQFSFLIPAVTLVVLYLHFEYWGPRRISFFEAVYRFLLPGALLLFACWILPLLASKNMAGFCAGLLGLQWIAMLPGLFAAAIAFAKNERQSARLCGAMAGSLLVLALLFTQTGLTQWPSIGSRPPELAMPKVARALRDDLRRHEPKPVTIAASRNLWEPLNFYRRRYALGAVVSVVPPDQAVGADYLILLPRDQAPAAGTARIFTNGFVSLYRRTPP